MEFRTICKHMGTRSFRRLTSDDRAPDDTVLDVAEIRQFAEVASAGPTYFNFPLKVTEGRSHDPLAHARLVRSIQGSVAGLDAFVAFRMDTEQLVIAISGTTSMAQIRKDLCINMHKYRYAPRASVHTGFWKLYKGIRQGVQTGIREGLKEHNVRQIVITGHSMGGAIAYLLALGLLREHMNDIPENVPIKLIVFGAPRCGNNRLVEHWLDVKRNWMTHRGRDSCIEISVKACNDGVSALPPKWLGFRHFAQNPFFLSQDRIYRIPSSEREHTIFKIDDQSMITAPSPYFSKGGHYYYFSSWELPLKQASDGGFDSEEISLDISPLLLK